MLDSFIHPAFSFFLFIFPLYFLPLGNTSIDYDKQVVLIFFSSLLFLFSLIKIFRGRKSVLTSTPFDFPLLFISGIFVASTIFMAPNKVGSFTAPLGTGTILALTFLYFSLTQQHFGQSDCPQCKPATYFYPLIIPALFISFLVIISQFNLPTISPLGNLLSSFLYLLVIGVFLAAHLALQIPSLKTKKIKLLSLLIHAAVTFIILAGSVVSLFRLSTDTKTLILPFSFGWHIMMEVFKNFGSFLLGVGPSNFSYAYTIAKPVSLNATPFWNLIPTSSSSYFFTLTTEVGIFAALSFLFLMIKAISLLTVNTAGVHFARISDTKPVLISLITALVLQFFLPSNIVLLTLTVILLAAATPRKQFTLKRLIPSSYIIAAAFLLFGLIIYFQAKIYLADISYRTSISLANNQKLPDAYGRSLQAINFDPYKENYYLYSGSLAMTLAQNLAQNPNASDSAKNISYLMQQAESFASTATQLNSLNSQNWAQLAAVYQALTGSVQGAEQFSLDAYSRQMALDPVSPQPRVAAAGLLLSLSSAKDASPSARANLLSQAYSLLLQAVNLKPDWNTTRFNLAQLFLRNKDYPNAAAELQRTLDLTPADSEDYKNVQKMLDQVKLLTPGESTPSASPTSPPSPRSSTVHH